MSEGETGINLDRLPQFANCMLQLPFFLQRFAKVGAGQRVSWIESLRLSLFGDAAIDVTLPSKHHPQSDMRISKFGVQFNRFPAFGKGLIQLSLVSEYFAEVGSPA